jgi:hypothetical protein
VKAATGATDPLARKAPAMSRTESTYLFSDPDTDPEIHSASATAHLTKAIFLNILNRVSYLTYLGRSVHYFVSAWTDGPFVLGMLDKTERVR